MDEVITRLYKEVQPETYDSIDNEFVLDFLERASSSARGRQYRHLSSKGSAAVRAEEEVGSRHSFHVKEFGGVEHRPGQS